MTASAYIPAVRERGLLFLLVLSVFVVGVMLAILTGVRRNLILQFAFPQKAKDVEHLKNIYRPSV